MRRKKGIIYGLCIAATGILAISGSKIIKAAGQSGATANYNGAIDFTINIDKNTSSSIAHSNVWTLTGDNTSLFAKTNNGYSVAGTIKGNSTCLFSSAKYKQVYLKAINGSTKANITKRDGKAFSPDNAKANHSDGLNHTDNFVSFRIPQFSETSTDFVGYEVTSVFGKVGKEWKSLSNSGQNSLYTSNNNNTSSWSLYDLSAGKVSEIKFNLKPILTTAKTTIKFDSDGGNSVSDINDAYYGKNITLPTPSKSGYNFAGWYDSNGVKYESGQWKVTSNIQLKAKWTSNTIYNVEVDADGGLLSGNNTVDNSSTYTFSSESNEFTFASLIGRGSNPNFPQILGNGSNPLKLGYTFKGWEVTEGKANISFNSPNWICKITEGTSVKIKALWTSNSQVLTFDSDGGSACDTINSEYGTTVILPTPSKDNCTFAGWVNESGLVYEGNAQYTVTGNANFKAKWVTKAATVHYRNFANSTNGTLLGSKDVTKNYGDNVSSEDFTEEYTGYTKGDTVTKSVDSDNVYIDTIYNSNIYRIDLYDDATDSYTKLYEKYGVDIYTNEDCTKIFDRLTTIPTKKGYTFGGYRFNNLVLINKNGERTAAFSNKTARFSLSLDADWNGKISKLVYNLNLSAENNPTINDVSKEVTYNDYYGNLAIPTARHYSFEGWYFADGTKIESYDIVKVLNDTNIYAHWKENSYTIAYKSNCPTAQKDNDTMQGYMSSQTVLYTETTTINDCQYSLNGYTFLGWNTKVNGSGKAFKAGQEVSKLTSDTQIKLYAQWEENSYSLSYDVNLPESYKSTIATPAESTYKYEDFFWLENLEDITGYTFLGWNTQKDGSGKMYYINEEGHNLCGEKDGKITIYAQWTPIRYTVSFNANKPVNFETSVFGKMNNIECVYDKKESLDKNNYILKSDNVPIAVFTGWNTKEDGSGLSFEDGDDFINLTEKEDSTVTLYAQWKINSYTICYYANKPEDYIEKSIETPTTQKVLYGNNETIAYIDSISGYKFISWNTEADGSGETYVSGDIVKNLSKFDNTKIKLYAQWEKSNYTVSFNPNVLADDNISVYGYVGAINIKDTTVIPACSYKIYNNDDVVVAKFTKWNESSDGNGKSYSPGDTISISDKDNIVLYAQWIYFADENNTEITVNGKITKNSEIIKCNSKSSNCSVKVNNQELIKDIDYTITYNYDDDTNEGTISIIMKGDYSGSFTRTYTVNNKTTPEQPTKEPENNDSKNNGSEDTDIIINGGESNSKPNTPSSNSSISSDNNQNDKADNNTSKKEDDNQNNVNNNNSSDNKNNSVSNDKTNDKTNDTINNPIDNNSGNSEDKTDNSTNKTTKKTLLNTKKTTSNGITVTRRKIAANKRSAKITISWKKVKKAKRYIVYCKKNNKWKKIKTTSKNKVTITIKKTEKYKVISQKKIIKKAKGKKGKKKTTYKTIKTLTRTVKFK